MPTATLTSKGQITLPLPVRNALNLHTGAKLDFVQDGDGYRLVPLRPASNTLKGRFSGRVKQAVSLTAMDKAIAEEASTRNSMP